MTLNFMINLRKVSVRLLPTLWWASICFLLACPAAAQQLPTDSTASQVASPSVSSQPTAVDPSPSAASEAIYKPLPTQPNPKRAGLYSALLPGAGQAYNHEYWKIPIIYAGIATSAYFYNFNRTRYRTYRQAYISRIDNDPQTTDAYVGIYTDGSLQTLQDVYKRYLDLTVLFTALGFTVQVLDAIAFSHLRNFDISPDLSIHYSPVILPSGGIGFGLTARF